MEFGQKFVCIVMRIRVLNLICKAMSISNSWTKVKIHSILLSIPLNVQQFLKNRKKKNLMNNDSLCLKSHHSLTKEFFWFKKNYKKKKRMKKKHLKEWVKNLKKRIKKIMKKMIFYWIENLLKSIFEKTIEVKWLCNFYSLI